MGKYLALVTIYAIPIAVLATYPPIMSKFGTVAFGSAYTALLGFFLLGSAKDVYKRQALHRLMKMMKKSLKC